MILWERAALKSELAATGHGSANAFSERPESTMFHVSELCSQIPGHHCLLSLKRHVLTFTDLMRERVIVARLLQRQRPTSVLHLALLMLALAICVVFTRRTARFYYFSIKGDPLVH